MKELPQVHFQVRRLFLPCSKDLFTHLLNILANDPKQKKCEPMPSCCCLVGCRHDIFSNKKLLYYKRHTLRFLLGDTCILTLCSIFNRNLNETFKIYGSLNIKTFHKYLMSTCHHEKRYMKKNTFFMRFAVCVIFSEEEILSIHSSNTWKRIGNVGWQMLRTYNCGF